MLESIPASCWSGPGAPRTGRRSITEQTQRGTDTFHHQSTTKGMFLDCWEEGSAVMLRENMQTLKRGRKSSQTQTHNVWSAKHDKHRLNCIVSSHYKSTVFKNCNFSATAKQELEIILSFNGDLLQHSCAILGLRLEKKK